MHGLIIYFHDSVVYIALNDIVRRGKKITNTHTHTSAFVYNIKYAFYKMQIPYERWITRASDQSTCRVPPLALAVTRCLLFVLFGRARTIAGRATHAKRIICDSNEPTAIETGPLRRRRRPTQFFCSDVFRDVLNLHKNGLLLLTLLGYNCVGKTKPSIVIITNIVILLTCRVCRTYVILSLIIMYEIT